VSTITLNWNVLSSDIWILKKVEAGYVPQTTGFLDSTCLN
jgi:hypothetical protein